MCTNIIIIIFVYLEKIGCPELYRKYPYLNNYTTLTERSCFVKIKLYSLPVLWMCTQRVEVLGLF